MNVVLTEDNVIRWSWSLVPTFRPPPAADRCSRECRVGPQLSAWGLSSQEGGDMWAFSLQKGQPWVPGGEADPPVPSRVGPGSAGKQGFSRVGPVVLQDLCEGLGEAMPGRRHCRGGPGPRAPPPPGTVENNLQASPWALSEVEATCSPPAPAPGSTFSSWPLTCPCAGP